MVSRSWVLGGICVMTVTVLLCLWLLVADGYVRFFMDVAVAQFLC
jgi:hypothetical protein